MALMALAVPLVHCSSAPKHKYAADTDIPTEISKIDEQLKMATQEQFNVFAPRNYRRAHEALSDAQKAQAKKKDRKNVLEKLGEARAATDLVFQRGEAVKKDLSDVALARDASIKAGALFLSRDELADVDAALKDETEILEEDADKTLRQKDRAELQSAYLNLELRTIKKDKLGVARNFIDSAKEADAKKFAPQSLAKAEEKYVSAEKVLEASRHDENAYAAPVLEATNQARELLKITLTARNAKKMTPEQIAMEISAQEKAIQKSLGETRNLRETASEQGAALRALSEENAILATDVNLSEKIKEIEGRFSKSEADVYRQGDSVVVRLKSLQFPSSRAELPSSSLSTLAKVNDVIEDLGPAQVVVEGHTDSIGGKQANEALSQKRAQAVSDYLISKESLEPSQVSTVGVGDEKPISSNKTKRGRAQNRRVDVIIKTRTL